MGVRYPVNTRASAYAFPPLGFAATTSLAGLWMVGGDLSSSEVYAFLAVVVAMMMLVGGTSGFLDMFLVPLTYFGGFTVAMLTFRGYPPPLQASEGGGC